MKFLVDGSKVGESTQSQTPQICLAEQVLAVDHGCGEWRDVRDSWLLRAQREQLI